MFLIFASKALKHATWVRLLQPCHERDLVAILLIANPRVEILVLHPHAQQSVAVTEQAFLPTLVFRIELKCHVILGVGVDLEFLSEVGELAEKLAERELEALELKRELFERKSLLWQCAQDRPYRFHREEAVENTNF